ncbi:hypothetical protein MHH60_06870 [Paenibacillus sp. FSL H7-0716]|uniref:Uncharacterized protein n=1 Tax=Paenibacillus odorifer TaxID=189426 RepID=A0AB36JMC6_9BACL|nr:hypothetical protein [Paenibacillus odorifer]OME17199.1 hypothetical protein BSK60_06790 [Paenibacillus odorifer]OME24694.1 hypothetical protein BSK47_01355 [Paenibacillus odorifer]
MVTSAESDIQDIVGMLRDANDEKIRVAKMYLKNYYEIRRSEQMRSFKTSAQAIGLCVLLQLKYSSYFMINGNSLKFDFLIILLI